MRCSLSTGGPGRFAMPCVKKARRSSGPMSSGVGQTERPLEDHPLSRRALVDRGRDLPLGGDFSLVRTTGVAARGVYIKLKMMYTSMHAQDPDLP